jgi:hypothetical protein
MMAGNFKQLLVNDGQEIHKIISDKHPTPTFDQERFRANRG